MFRVEITDEEIKNVVYSFYQTVRADSILGPIFASEMSEDWDQHMKKMVNFWSTVLFGKSLYNGNPLQVHRRIKNLRPEHFDHWLFLFKQTLIEVCPNNDHVDAFYKRANNMARVMKAALSLKEIRREYVSHH